MRQNWKVYLTITLSTSCLNCFRYFGTLVVLINFLSCERRVNSVVKAIQSSFHYSVLNNPRSHWFCFTRAPWLVRKICPTLSTNRMQNWNHSSCSPAFPRTLRRGVVFTLSSHWHLQVFSLDLIRRFDYFDFGFTTIENRYIPQNWNYLPLTRQGGQLLGMLSSAHV